MIDRIVNPAMQAEDEGQHFTFRPERLDEMIGQDDIRDQLSVFIEAARERKEPLEHALLVGPKGLGKTTLATVIANELDVGFKRTGGQVLERLELSQILTSLEPGDVLFIDEIHRVNIRVQEILYPAMEDFTIDLVIGQGGPGARAVHVPLPKFTLIGATTKEGLISGPLRDRFGVHVRMNFYAPEDLGKIIDRDGSFLKVDIEPAGRDEIARRARGTPRIAKRYLRRICDYALVRGDGVVTLDIAEKTLDMLGVDPLGLDEMDRRIMHAIIDRGGFAGLNTIAAAVSEDERTIEETYEPYLIQIGFLSRTSRGRSLTARAYRHIGIEPPPEEDLNSLF
jgi:Holliday junction DNA helicase RuvB